MLGGLEEEVEGDPGAKCGQEVVDGFDFCGSRGGPVQRGEGEGEGGWESGALSEPRAREEEGGEDHEGEGDRGGDAGGEFGGEVGVDGEGGGEDPGDELGLADIGLGEHVGDEVVVGVEHFECGDDSVSFGACEALGCDVGEGDDGAEGEEEEELDGELAHWCRVGGVRIGWGYGQERNT